MAWRPPIMKRRPTFRRRRRTTRSVLRLLDLEHAKTAVLNSLTSQDAQRGYRHAIDEFVDWYCSEPRLAFNRIVVLRYRSHLESRRSFPQLNLHRARVHRNHGRPRPNGFTGRAQNSPPPFTPQRERASGKALTFIRRDPAQATENLDYVFGRKQENCFCACCRASSVSGFWA